MAAPKLDSLENRIAVVREYAGLWQQFFGFFSEGLSDKTITPQEDQQFQNIVSILALNHYKFQEMTAGYYKDAAKVLDVLYEAVSLDHVKNLPDATFSKLQVEWHTQFIMMNKILGKMLGELPPKRLAELQRGEA
jgi:hypothetical protein